MDRDIIQQGHVTGKRAPAGTFPLSQVIGRALHDLIGDQLGGKILHPVRFCLFGWGWEERS